MSEQAIEVLMPEELCAPPLWLIKQICYPQRDNDRLPKYKRIYEWESYSRGNDMPSSYYNRLPGHYNQPGPCRDALTRFTHSRGWSGNSGTRTGDDEDASLVAVGNLPNNDYAFFNGAAHKDSTWSTCRWCQSTMFNETCRLEHRRELDKSIGTSHAKALNRLYADLSQRGVCVICDDATFHRKWGVPICNTRSCLEQWKFTTRCVHNRVWIGSKHSLLTQMRAEVAKLIIVAPNGREDG